MLASKTLPVLLWLPLLAACQHTPPQDSVPANLAALQQVVESDATDDTILTAIEKFNHSISDAELGQVERFAKAHAAGRMGWPLLYVLVVRHRFDSAVEVAVIHLSKQKEDRQYRMWKWWEHSFSGRKDYAELNKEVGQAYLRLFNNSDQAKREVIADIFGQKNLSPQEFKELIEGKK
jgi:hypothetical protein